MATIHTQSRGFVIVVAIGSAAGLALTITNAVFFSRARNNCLSVSNNAANTMMWLNIILAVILGFVFIWAIYRLVVHPDLQQELAKQAKTYLGGRPEGIATTRQTAAAQQLAAQRVPLAQPVTTVTSQGGVAVSKTTADLLAAGALPP